MASVEIKQAIEELREINNRHDEDYKRALGRILCDQQLPEFGRNILGITGSPDTLRKWQETADCLSGLVGSLIYVEHIPGMSSRRLGYLTGPATTRVVLPSEAQGGAGALCGVFLEAPIESAVPSIGYNGRYDSGYILSTDEPVLLARSTMPKWELEGGASINNLRTEEADYVIGLKAVYEHPNFSGSIHLDLLRLDGLRAEQEELAGVKI
ncbi:MAG: hypothetical protein ABI220_05820 [Candidatus Saccharimonadales bacterium]